MCPSGVVGEGMSQWCGRRGCVPEVWLERVCPSGVVGEGVSQWCGRRGCVPVVWLERACLSAIRSDVVIYSVSLQM